MHRLAASAGRLVVAVAVGCCLWPLASPCAEKDSSYLSAMSSIREAELREHVDYLADDQREGREAGSRGGRAAADYLRAELEQLQLARAGVDAGYFQPFGPNFRNVLALLEGSDPDARSEYVVVGAHYDHVGYGTRRNSLGRVGAIHNGADDNASGTSGLLELAEAFAILPEPPRRSILFVFWDAEEKGLLGSKHWVAHPMVPLERVAAVLNMDMIGRLRDDRVVVFGSRTGYGLRRLVCCENEELGLAMKFSWTMEPNADHYPFFGRGIPVLMLHTGLHDNYHRPSDDAERINAEGMQRVVRLMFGVVYELADRDQVPGFREAARHEARYSLRRLLAQVPHTGDRLGARWEEPVSPGGSVRLTSVVLGSPADHAKLRPGDRILQFADREIHSGGELAQTLMSAENPVPVIVERPGNEEPLQLTLELNGTPMRLGITWRVDDAEPGTIILTHVVPGSPAAQAGLEVGDRIYQIAGRDFAADAEFSRLAKTLPGPLTLLVERDGRLRSAELHVQTAGMDDHAGSEESSQPAAAPP